MKFRKAVAQGLAVRNGERALYQRIRDLVLDARKTVARGVDLVQVRANYEIGRHIVAYEQQGEKRAEYGKEVLRRLGKRLNTEFGGGFSETQLKLVRQFFLLYENRMPIPQTVSGELGKAKKSQSLTGELSSPNKSQAKIGKSAISQTVSDQLDASKKKPQKSSVPRPLKQRAFSLSWSHYVFLIGIKNPDELSFYEIEATEQH